jgi:hypothetical protein
LEEPGKGIVGIECAAPSAPPLAAGAAEAGTAQGGLKELWGVYDYKKGLKAAKDAYRALAPDADLHARLLVAAGAWRAAWAAQNKPDAPRKHLATWLKDEEYECDPPSGYVKREKGKPAAANGNANGVFPYGSEHRCRIESAVEFGSKFGEWGIDLTLVGIGGKLDGQTFEHRLEVFALEGTSFDYEQYHNLRDATDAEVVEDFIGETVIAFNIGENRIDFKSDTSMQRRAA